MARETFGERKLVTVLFADVVGSTAMGGWIDPEDITEIMNGAFGIMNDAVARHHGMVARLMGDAILAFFGAQVARENDAEQAVRAALEIRTAAGAYAGRIRERFGADFQVRIGINTGLAVLDIVGNQVRSEFTAMGDAVNLASRLQNAAEPGSILISHDTYRHVRGLFVIQPLDPILVKGKNEPLRVYRVQEAREHAFHQPTRGVAGIETPMIGRQTEFKQLQENFQALWQDGHTRASLVTILGEAGVGKSRLLYEFSNWLDLQPDEVHILRARATEQRAHLPYSLLRVLLTSELNIHDSDSEALAHQKLQRGIAKLVLAGHDDLSPVIGHLIGYNYTDSPQLSGILDDAQQIRDRAFIGVVQIFRAILRGRPVLILLEDMHWADEGSLDFLGYLTANCLDLPLMVICLARQTLLERRPDWAADLSRHLRIELTGLSEEESRALVSAMLYQLADAPAYLYDLVVEQAEGNPYYIEEAIRMLVDDGMILIGPDSWQISPDRPLEAKIPPTVTGLLQARLDSLPTPERKVLNCASVAGRVFWDDLTTRMLASDESAAADLDEITQTALLHLQQRDLIYRLSQPAFVDVGEYIFKQAALREVTYDLLLKRLRRTYHLQVAQWLQSRCGERVDIYAGQIGEHYERAGEALQAAVWYARAGKQAQDTYVPEMAVDYYKKALGTWLSSGDLSRAHHSQMVELLHGLGQVYTWLGRYEDATAVFQQMNAAAQKLGDEGEQARAWRGIAEVQMHHGDVRAAIRSAQQVENLASNAATQLEKAKALWLKAWGAFRLGEMETAFSLAGQVMRLSQELQDPGQMAHSYNLIGVLESSSGRFVQAAEYFERALEIFTGLGNRRRAMPLMNNLGVIFEALGSYPEALSRYREALQTAREIGNRDGEMVYLSNLGGVRNRLGEFAAAEADLRQVIQMAGSTGQDVLSSTYSFLAAACLGQNKLHEALVSAQQALAIALAMEAQDDQGVAWRALGRVAAAQGESIPVEVEKGGVHGEMAAGECFRESERIFIEIEREDERARTLREWARYEMSAGDQVFGRRMWEQALKIFSQLGAHREVERMEETG
jgi:class 3 adenylate cyclase/tetratricopeptide (TPR) repeat protein